MSQIGPLSGKRVLLPRAAHQVAPTMELLRERGAEPVPFPVIAMVAPPDPAYTQTVCVHDTIGSCETQGNMLKSPTRSAPVGWRKIKNIHATPQISGRLVPL